MAGKADKHPPGPCRDEECGRAFCAGYRLGYGEGYITGYADGSSAASGR